MGTETNSREVTVLPAAGKPAHFEWDEQKIELVKRTICRGSTDDELQMFMMVCKRTGLDPFAKQVYAVKRWDNKAGREIMSIQTSVDGYRLIAERSGKYEGQTATEWCGADGVWRDVWLDKAPPRAARVGVHKTNFREPLRAVAMWDSYVQTNKEGKPTAMWTKMPELMLAKVAETLALRKAFPQELSGLYTGEEMAQAESPSHEAPTQIQPPPPKPEKVVTRDQLTRLFAIARTCGWVHDELKAQMQKMFPGIQSSSELSMTQYDVLVSFIENNHRMTPGVKDVQDPFASVCPTP